MTPGRPAGQPSPPEPVDKDIYEPPPDEMADIQQVPTSLDQVLNPLEADHDFLSEGSLFTPDLIVQQTRAT